MTEHLTGKPTDIVTTRRQTIRTILAVALLIILGVAGQFLRPRSSTPPPPTTTLAPPTKGTPVYLPAEFSPQDELLLGGHQLAELFPDVLTSIVDAVGDDIRIRIMTASQSEQSGIKNLLAGAGLGSAPVTYLQLPIITMWVRDFGPLSVVDGQGQLRLRGFHYRERRGNATDDGVPGHLAQVMALPLVSSPILLEGGDFISNGLGLCLVSTRVVNRNAHYLDLTADQTITEIAGRLGFEDISLLYPLQGESTGHADMFCAFLRPDLIAVGRYDAAADSVNAVQLDDLAESLAERATRAGPLQVARLPMPDHDDGVWRTYTNVVFANDVLLVPVYPDYCPELDTVALATYERLLPDRRVIGIDASQLIRMNGALRCITMNIPRARLPGAQ